MGYTGAMNQPTPSETWSRLVPLGVMAASVGALAIAYTAQYGFAKEPCALCLYQRLPYAVTGVLGLLALAVPPGRPRAAVVALCGAVFLAGAGIAFYHVGVQQHWWAAITACGGPPATELTPEQMLAQLRQGAPRPCDRIEWAVFGISAAAYNVVASLALAAATLAGARRLG